MKTPWSLPSACGHLPPVRGRAHLGIRPRSARPAAAGGRAGAGLLLACLWTLLAALSAGAIEIEEELTLPAIRPGGVTLEILSSGDLERFRPVLRAFHAAHPAITLVYRVAGTRDIHAALTAGEEAPDLVLSSAMGLQFRLANDGQARTWSSPATEALPPWAHWRREVIAFTQEPAVVVVRREALAGVPAPTTRAALVRLLASHAERFRGRLGTYDIRRSGFGYLAASEDARLSDVYWRLTQEMGGLAPRLYCCSGDMLDDLESGAILLAYNVLGSYAEARIQGREDLVVLRMRDYTNVMLRTALISRQARHPAAAGTFIDFLLSPPGREALAAGGLPPLDPAALTQAGHLRPIRLGPALLVALDPLTRQAFEVEWQAALEQP